LRIKSTLYNSIIAVLSYVALAVLGLVLRKFFLVYLPTDYLGYEGLFSNIFAILSVADLGINGIVLYRMYPALNRQDEAQIQKLMSVYRLLYRIVGTGIAIIGVGLIPLLKVIIPDNQLNWTYVYLVYILQLVISLCTYFLAYKRVMFIATMQEAVATKIETTSTFISTLFKIGIILITKNYILYIIVGVVNNIVMNAVIAYRANVKYPYIKKSIKITKSDITALELGHDLKNNLFQKLSVAIYGGTDSILISMLLGISYVGLLSNYILISGYVSALLNKLLNPFQVSIGNFVHDETKDRKEAMFSMFDRISFFLAAFISTCFFALFNPFISLIYGEQYLLSTLYVLLFSANQYILYNHKFLYFFRSAFGKFEIDKWYAFAAAVINIVVSVMCAKYMGIAGIMLGTVVGHLGFWIGRAKVVYSEYLSESIWKYAGKQIINLLIWGGEFSGTYLICSLLPKGVIFLCLRFIICLLLPNAINLIVFYRTKDMAMIFEYLKKTKNAVKGRG